MSVPRGLVPLVVVHGTASDRVLAALVDSGYTPVAVVGDAVIWAAEQRQGADVDRSFVTPGRPLAAGVAATA